jgi:hypothetical protein
MFDFPLSHILKDSINPIANLIVNITGYANSTGFSQSFKPGRYVDPFTVNIAPVIRDIAYIDAYPEIQGTGPEFLLQSDGAGDSVLHRRKLN